MIFIFRNVLSIDEYASCFENIDPLAPYKKWATKLAATQNPKFNESAPRNDVFSERVQAAFIVSDPVDWSRDIQVTGLQRFYDGSIIKKRNIQLSLTLETFKLLSTILVLV